MADVPARTGQVAIVTGGTGALGQAVARRLLAAGAVLWVPFRDPAGADALRESVTADTRARIQTARADVADPDTCAAFVGGVRARHGRIDVLVNAVGGFAGGDLVSTSPETWHHMLAVNLTSTFVTCRAVLPAMIERRQGRIVNIASRAVVVPAGGFLAYTVAKSGVIALTRALAQEVRARQITVNAVCPSTMDTPANRAAMPDADRSRWVSVESVAEVVAFLASDAARDVTGATVTV